MFKTQQIRFFTETEGTVAIFEEYENPNEYSPLDVSSCTFSERKNMSIQYQNVAASTPASRKREQRRIRNQKLEQLSSL